MKIAIVDDESSMRFLLRIILESAGYEVLEAAPALRRPAARLEAAEGLDDPVPLRAPRTTWRRIASFYLALLRPEWEFPHRSACRYPRPRLPP